MGPRKLDHKDASQNDATARVDTAVRPGKGIPMKTVAITVLLLTLLAVVTPAADYEVTVDGKKYLFTDDVAQKVVIKEGKPVSISVSAFKTKVFQEHGISFRYPSDMKLAQEPFPGFKQVTVESTDSLLFMLTIFPAI